MVNSCKNFYLLFVTAASTGVLLYMHAVSPVSLKDLSTDYVIDNFQDEQKIQLLVILPKDIQDTIKERIRAHYKLQLFSALSLQTIPSKTTFQDHGEVFSVVFISDGRYALTGSLDKTIRIWNLEYTIKDLNLGQLLSLLKSSQTQVAFKHL